MFLRGTGENSYQLNNNVILTRSLSFKLIMEHYQGSALNQCVRILMTKQLHPLDKIGRGLQGAQTITDKVQLSWS